MGNSVVTYNPRQQPRGAEVDDSPSLSNVVDVEKETAATISTRIINYLEGLGDDSHTFDERGRMLIPLFTLQNGFDLEREADRLGVKLFSQSIDTDDIFSNCWVALLGFVMTSLYFHNLTRGYYRGYGIEIVTDSMKKSGIYYCQIKYDTPTPGRVGSSLAW